MAIDRENLIFVERVPPKTSDPYIRLLTSSYMRGQFSSGTVTLTVDEALNLYLQLKAALEEED